MHRLYTGGYSLRWRWLVIMALNFGFRGANHVLRPGLYICFLFCRCAAISDLTVFKRTETTTMGMSLERTDITISTSLANSIIREDISFHPFQSESSSLWNAHRYSNSAFFSHTNLSQFCLASRDKPNVCLSLELRIKCPIS